MLQGRRGIKHGSKKVRVTTERRFSFNLPRKRSMFKPHLKSNPATGKVGRGSGLGLNQQIAGRQPITGVLVPVAVAATVMLRPTAEV